MSFFFKLIVTINGIHDFEKVIHNIQNLILGVGKTNLSFQRTGNRVLAMTIASVRKFFSLYQKLSLHQRILDTEPSSPQCIFLL